MAEQFADLIEGDFLPKQVGGQRVAEQMRSLARRIDASVYQRAPNDGGDGDGVCKTTHRSSMSKKNSATGTAWAAEAQITCDCFADVGWQRHLGHASTFAMDGDPTVVPIDIIQRKANHPYKCDSRIPEWHGWHAARRGLGSNLYRLGVPDMVIQRILRHANVSTTATYYIKTAADDVKHAMEKLEKHIPQTAPAVQDTYGTLEPHQLPTDRTIQ
jgi:Phage integrase family